MSIRVKSFFIRIVFYLGTNRNKGTVFPENRMPSTPKSYTKRHRSIRFFTPKSIVRKTKSIVVKIISNFKKIISNIIQKTLLIFFAFLLPRFSISIFG